MSRHNKLRRRWRCLDCGAGMWRELASRSARVAADAAAAGRLRDARVVHVCGACKTCHYPEGDGLRKLTLAEMFELHVELPNTLARIGAASFPDSPTPAGTLVLGAD